MGLLRQVLAGLKCHKCRRGVLLTIVGVCLSNHLLWTWVEDDRFDLLLSQRSITVPGQLMDSGEDYEGESDTGEAMLSSYIEYRYITLDGKRLTRTKSLTGGLDAEYLMPTNASFVVDYVPDKPSVSRIRLHTTRKPSTHSVFFKLAVDLILFAGLWYCGYRVLLCVMSDGDKPHYHV